MRRTLKKRGGAAIAIAAVGALALTACATADSGEGETLTYVFAIDDDPRGMNAQFVRVPEASMFSAQMLEPLIFMSSDYELTPGLAESWELSDDGLELVFTLREGVTWHDGEPFTAEDVKFNFEEIDPVSSYSWSIESVLESIEIEGDTEVTLSLSEPFGPLLEAISQHYMLPQHIYEGTEYITNDANMAPIGTGPMMFESYSSGEEVTLLKNPDYWGGEIAVDRAVFPIMGDANSRAEALFSGEIDQGIVPFSQRPRVEEDPNTVFLEETAHPQVVSLGFNALGESLQDAAVRQAVYAAFDRENISDDVLQGLGEPARTFFPEALGWANSPNVDLLEQFPHDVDAINQALDDAGFPRGDNGERFTLDIRYSTARPDTAAIAEVAQSKLAEVGIGLNLMGSAGAVFAEAVFTDSDFDLVLIPNTSGADPSLALANWYACNEEKLPSANPSQLCDDQIDAAVDAAAATSNVDERSEAFAAMSERAAEVMIYAPLVWFNGTFPSANTTRWDGQTEKPVDTSRVPWTSLTPKA
ncbi:ABC transporter substrate-binding protein [Pseudoclavibacter endophyticus]|nr:ABC transporter substrate-binding protein [Pseudoclavibacter endophyticus]